jgi:hypothetical protein
MPAHLSRASIPQRVNPSAIGNEVFNRHADILRDLPKQWRRDIASFMERHGGTTPSGISELLVGAPLADELEPQFSEDFGHFRRFQNGD